MIAETTWQDVSVLLINNAVAILTALGVIVTALTTWRVQAQQVKNAKVAADKAEDLDTKIEVVHKATNSMSEKLALAAGKQGYSDGVRDEKERVAPEHVEKNIIALNENTDAIKENTEEKA